MRTDSGPTADGCGRMRTDNADGQQTDAHGQRTDADGRRTDSGRTADGQRTDIEVHAPSVRKPCSFVILLQ